MVENTNVSAVNGGKISVNRRKFMAGAAALSFTVIKPELVRGTAANSKIRLGLVGCGGRGSWIAKLFKANGNYEIVAAADYFQDRVESFGGKFNVPQARRFTGLSCHKKMLAEKLDAVAIISPPYFHAEQAACAVEAGVHVYVAKPIAVDVPGCNSIGKSGKKATRKKLCFLVDFQTRANAFYVEAVKRVHNGDIGELCFGESSYLTGRLGTKTPPGTPEARLRNWVFDKALSGDIITEQNIHTLDVASWIMNTAPIHASGTGGRKSRTDVGDCWDHFSLSFVYPNNIGVTFMSKQYKGYGSPGGIKNRMFGTKGTLETEYGGQVLVRGEKFYRGGKTSQIYQEGAVNNIADFHKNITEGKFDNPTVPPSVRSNLVTILGRTAAYTGERVYWDKFVKSTEKIDGRLKGLKI
ncbi:MAG: Gfo/Idh/MocA family oxidoreductase [Planctomycetes bacterium]|nr:Gfo/Idh/MocA family oxidoreductase [Planctomycetota bacterium]